MLCPLHNIFALAMYISFIFVSISFELGPVFQWNNYRLIVHTVCVAWMWKWLIRLNYSRKIIPSVKLSSYLHTLSNHCTFLELNASLSFFFLSFSLGGGGGAT